VQRAFYLLAPGGWRDYANLLHAPYTVWHLSYVVLGAALVPDPDYGLMVWTLLAFLLAMGVGAHIFDELHDRPLRTTIPSFTLWGIGLVAVALAVLIGLIVGLAATPLILPLIAIGALLVFAYNLEWGPFHHDLVFAFAWGAFPVLTSYIAQTGTLSATSVLAAVIAAALSSVQRTLSTRVRHLRRNVIGVSGHLVEFTGDDTTLTIEWLLQDHERVLLLLSLVVPAVSVVVLLK